MKKGKRGNVRIIRKNTEQKRIRGRKDNEEKVEKERRINLGKKGRGGTRGTKKENEDKT